MRLDFACDKAEFRNSEHMNEAHGNGRVKVWRVETKSCS